MAFLTIVSIFSGFLIFLLILVVNEAKTWKKRKKSAARANRASISNQRPSINPTDIHKFYETINIDFSDKNSSNDGGSIVFDDSDVTITAANELRNHERSLISEQFYDTPDTAKNAETLLRELFTFEVNDNADDDETEKEVIYENVPNCQK